MTLKIMSATQKLTKDNQENPIKKAVTTIDDRVKEINGILGTVVSAVDGSFNSKEVFNKLKNDVAKKYGIDSALDSINKTMGLVKSFEMAFQGTPNDGSPKAMYGQTTSVAQYQYPSDLGGMYMQIGLKEWKKLGAFGKNTMNSLASIALPLPRNLVEQHAIDYKQTNLGALVGGSKQIAVGASSGDGTNLRTRFDVSAAAAITQAVIIGAQGAAIRDLEKTAAVGGSIVASLADAGSDLVVTTANMTQEIKEQGVFLAEQVLGMAYNPNITLILSGPRLRSHQFTWTLAAKNYEESKQIKEIIQQLRKAMLPSSADGFIYKYPNYALIRIHPQNDFLYKFKPCVITGLSVNYAGSGSPSFMPGKQKGNNPPTIVELTLSFQEVEVIIRENVESGDEFLSSATKDGTKNLLKNVKGVIVDSLQAQIDILAPSVSNIPFAGTAIESAKEAVDNAKKYIKGDGPNG